MVDEKEFMASVPESILVDEKYIQDDDNIFQLSIKDMLLHIENSEEFYHNPTRKVMIKVLKQFLKDCIETLTVDATYDIENTIPLFLKDEFKPNKRV